jgi:hypothetical protein
LPAVRVTHRPKLKAQFQSHCFKILDFDSV